MKRTISIILCLTLILSSALMFSGCSKDADTKTEVISTESSTLYDAFQEDELVGEIESSITEKIEKQENEGKVNTVDNDYDATFLTWTFENWQNASQIDKLNCSTAYVGYIGDLLGLPVTSDDKELLDSVAESLGKALEANPDFTVQELVVYSLASDEGE